LIDTKGVKSSIEGYAPVCWPAGQVTKLSFLRGIMQAKS
jgi:hypothetical protein